MFFEHRLTLDREKSLKEAPEKMQQPSLGADIIHITQ